MGSELQTMNGQNKLVLSEIMLNDFNGADKIYIACGYTDLRRGIDGLASRVQEDNFAELTPDERYQQRLEQAKPVLDALLAWANVRNAAPKSALGKALTYLKEQWPYLTNYLKDGRLELSNNRAERSIKPFVIDRKNFLFANTPGGAKGSAVIFTMIQTAIENHLAPYRYLTWLLKAANTADLTRPEVIEQFLPWNAPQESGMQNELMHIRRRWNPHLRRCFIRG